jgi:hypothetical protein
LPGRRPHLRGVRGQPFLAAQQRDPGLARVVIEGRDVVTKTLRARALPSE